MKNNNKYVSYHIILADILRKYKSTQFDPDSVNEWCFIFENRYLTDVSALIKYIGVELTVSTLMNNKAAEQPCNIMRILNVYDKNGKKVPYTDNGSFFFLDPSYPYDSLTINYIGTAMDENGDALIIKGHENACEVFCKLQRFEEDWAMGRFDKTTYATWQVQLSGMMQHVLQSVKYMDLDELNHLDEIRGNLIKKIGNLKLYQNI